MNLGEGHFRVNLNVQRNLKTLPMYRKRLRDHIRSRYASMVLFCVENCGKTWLAVDAANFLRLVKIYIC